MTSVSWDDLKCLLLVARKGSLSGAAGALGVSVATLGRRMDALEAGLGFKTVRRSPQGAQVTREGLRVLELIAPGAERFDQLERLARSLAADAQRSPVRISSTEPMIADVLAAHLPRLLDARPDIRIELESSLELSNLNRGQADIAVRMMRPEGETLITRRLPAIAMGLFASQSYFEARGSTVHCDAARLVWYDSAYGDIAENVWLRTQGLEDKVVMRSGSVRALLKAAEAGLGMAPVPAFLARQHKLLLADAPALPDRIPWLVFHRDTRQDASMKAVRAWIEAACRHAFEDPAPVKLQP
jgi:DNA-binding transcriptional LysR family regulator